MYSLDVDYKPLVDPFMLKVNNTLKILGIDGCANTVVGDGEYFAIASSIIIVIPSLFHAT